ncbi:MAG: hypothetical protein U0793_21945 [Gemmataceae bacterium]
MKLTISTVAALSAPLALLLLGCGRNPPPVASPTAAVGPVASPETKRTGGYDTFAPPGLKKGVKVVFVVTNDHPFAGKYLDVPQVEEVQGSWVRLSANYKEEEADLQTKVVWQNFNNVVWYRVVE